ncbi:MAG: hypothetical protein ABI886_17530, partial [Betaproteobacteria bacterium]
TGSIIFRLYGPNDATCVNAAVFVSNAITVSGNGTYTSAPGFTPATAGVYRWRAFYSGDANNAAVSGACGAANESVTITQTTPTIATTASAGGGLGTAVTDQATLALGFNPTGSIIFRLYGPNDATCVNAAVFVSNAITVSGNGTYTSAPGFTTVAAGTYRWRAFYSGDANNVAVAGACNDTGENVSIGQATPTIATTASATVKLGGTISDTAALGGGTSPTGTITFRLYGPNDATCVNPAVFTTTASVTSGNGNYTSPAFTPTLVGTYRWIASYGGDANNASVNGNCNDANESVVVSQATPAIATTASATVKLGGTISDTATLSNGQGLTGTITFKLYGPNDATCANPAIFTTTASVTSGNGSYTSPTFTPAAVGTYRWIASYGGDAGNAAVSGACNDASESVVVTQSAPTIATTASAGGAVGTGVTDTATLANAVNATGSITFRLYGPNDATCANPPVYTSAPVVVSGNGSYASASFTTAAAGTFRWIATYSGDANNASAAGACNDANESVVVTPAAPLFATNAGGPASLGQPVHDTATLSNGATPTGTITFNLYGPNDATCATTPVFTSVVNVTGGNGAYSSASFVPTGLGLYRWTAAYSGDANNASMAGACNDANESVSIGLPPPPSTPVPTLSAAWLAVLSLLLTLLGGALLRRRRT